MNHKMLKAITNLPLEVQDQLQVLIEKKQLERGKLTATGEAGAGMVKVTIGIDYKIHEVKIDTEMSNENRQLIQNMIIAAHNVAMNKIEIVFKEWSSDTMQQIVSLAKSLTTKP